MREGGGEEAGGGGRKKGRRKEGKQETKHWSAITWEPVIFVESGWHPCSDLHVIWENTEVVIYLRFFSSSRMLVEILLKESKKILRETEKT